jgi:hypothetical protein
MAVIDILLHSGIRKLFEDSMRDVHCWMIAAMAMANAMATKPVVMRLMGLKGISKRRGLG